jgi:nitrogen fixation/metabolism regulation signal transduction histidine kinase
VSLRRKFQLYLLFVHAVFAAAAVILLWEQRVWLLVLELFFSLSFLVGTRLLRSLAEPVEVIRSGVELIAASDFTTRFNRTGQAELDELILVYNRMLDTLREARVRNEEQESFLQRILETSPSGVLTLDPEDRIARLNPAARSMLGLSEEQLVGARLDGLGSSFADSLSRLGEGRPRILTLKGRRRVRVVRLSFMDRGIRRGFILLEELTEELRRSEKAAYEKLIRMLSHEVNNTSGAVASLLESSLNYGDQIAAEDRSDFEQALKVAINRTRHMNAFMQRFADVVRLPPPQPAACELKALLQDCARLLERESRERSIEWRWRFDGDPPEVKLDRTQMEQALLNVYRNALEAVGRDGSVTTIVRGAPGPAVVIEDSGPGLGPEVRDQLFMPFFTTKDDGQGIGLTVVQEILVAHGFDFALESAPGGPTRFSIFF